MFPQVSTGGAVLAADAAFAHVLAERIAVISQVPPYRPGQFCRRERSPLRAVPGRSERTGPAGCRRLMPTWTPAGRPGLSAHAQGEFGVLVIGVAKSRFGTAAHVVRSCAEPRDARCSSSRPGGPAPTRPAWSGAWPAGTGCPAPCTAPTPRAGRYAYRRHDRPRTRLTHPAARYAADECTCASRP